LDAVVAVHRSPQINAEPINPPAASATSRIRQWASGRLADYDARQSGTMFAKGVVLDVHKGMNFRRLWLNCVVTEENDFVPAKLF
jgi:hypothetical protein